MPYFFLDELRVAQKKAKKAEISDNLSSQTESLQCGRGFRKAKPRRRYNPDSSSSNNESSDESFQKNAFGGNYILFRLHFSFKVDSRICSER